MCLLPRRVRVMLCPFSFSSQGVFFDSRRDFKTHLEKMIKSLVIPYLCLGFVVYVFKMICLIIEGERSIYVFVHEFARFLYERKYMTLWFITTLFGVQLLFWIIKRFCGKWWMLVVVLCYLLGICYYATINMPLIWNLDVSLIAVFFFGMGYVYYSSGILEEILFKKKRWSIVLLVSIIVKFIAQRKSFEITGEQFSMFQNAYGFAPLTLLGNIADVLIVLIIAHIFSVRAIKYLGEYSLLYFAWHNELFFIPMQNYLFTSDIWKENVIMMVLEDSIIFGVLISVITLLDRTIRKSRLCFVLGKEFKKKAEVQNV